MNNLSYCFQSNRRVISFSRIMYRLIFISKADGSIDVWDFTDTCYNPLISIPLTTNRIVSMELLDCKESILNKNDFHQLLAIGDNLGSLYLI